MTVALPATVATDAVAREPVAPNALTFLTPFRLTLVIASLPSSFTPESVLSCAPVCPNASASPLTVPPARFDILLPFALRAASRAAPAHAHCPRVPRAKAPCPPFPHGTALLQSLQYSSIPSCSGGRFANVGVTIAGAIGWLPPNRPLIASRNCNPAPTPV